MFHAQEYAAEVDSNYPIPLLVGNICRHGNRLFNPCVVEGKVEAAELLKSSVQSSLHVFSPTHVAPYGKRTPAEFFDHARRLVVVVFRNIGDHHAGALARERQRRSATDAVRCAGHKGSPSCERSILVNSHSCSSVSLSYLARYWSSRPSPSIRRPFHRALPESQCGSWP